MKKWVVALTLIFSVSLVTAGLYMTSATNAQTAPLRPPGQFKATAAGSSGVLLTWGNQSSYAGIELWRWDSVEGSIFIGYYSPDATSWGTVGLPPGTYWFYAAGWDGSQYSEWVSTSVTIGPATSPLPTISSAASGPNWLRATAAGQRGVLLTWENDRTYQGMELWRWDSASGSVFLGYYWPNTTSWGTLDLKPGDYWFYVAGWDGTKYSEWASASVTIASESSSAVQTSPTVTRVPTPTLTPSQTPASGTSSGGPRCCGAPGVVDSTPGTSPTPTAAPTRIAPRSPSTPTNLTAIVNGTSVSLSWRDTSANETGFDVWSWSEADGWFHVATLPANITTISDEALTPGGTYYYRVAAFNASGQSAWVTATVSAPTVNLLGPSELKLESATPGLRITWRSDPQATGYELTRWNEAEGSRRIAFLLPGATSYLDKDVIARQTYFYYLASFNGPAYSKWLSASGEFKQGPPGPPPRSTSTPPAGPPAGTTPVPTPTARPTAVAVPTPTPNTARTRVTFNSADGVQLTGYYWGRGRTTAVVLSHAYAENQQTWRPYAELLSQNGYAVLSFDFRGYGESSGSRSVSYTEEDIEGAVSYLRASEGVRAIFLVGASMGGTASLLLAQRVNVNGIVAVSAPMNFMGLPAGNVSLITSPKLYLAASGDYDFAQMAQTMYDQSAPPKEIQIYGGNAHGEALAMGAASTRILEFLRRYQLTALNLNQRRGTNVVAHNVSRKEYVSSSTGLVAAAYAVDLPAPSSVSASVENGDEVRLAWKDNATNEAGYVVSRWDDRKGRLVWRFSANTTTFLDRKAVAGMPYTYEIAAVDADGSHSKSATVTFTIPIVPLNPPSNFRAEAVEAEGVPSVILSWRHRPSDEYDFEIHRQRDDEQASGYLTTVSGTDRSFVDGDVLPQHSYTYTIFTTDGLRYSERVQATAEIGIRLRQINPAYSASIGGDAVCAFLQKADGSVQLRITARGEAVAPTGQGIAIFFRPKGDAGLQSAFDRAETQWQKGLKETQTVTIPGRATFNWLVHDGGSDNTNWGVVFDGTIEVSGDGKAPSNYFVDIFVTKFDLDSNAASTSGGGLLQAARVQCSVTTEEQQGSPSISPPVPPRQEVTPSPTTRPTVNPLSFRVGALPDAEEGTEYLPNGQPYSFCDPPTTSFTTQCPPPGQIGRNPSGGNPPYHFQLGTAGGFPPIGMALGKDGQLTGIPSRGTGGRTYRFTVCAVDLSANSVCQEVSISVKAAPTPTPTPTRSPTPTPTRTPTATIPSGDGSIPSAAIQSFTCTRTIVQTFQNGGIQYEFTATASGNASGPVFTNVQVTLSTQYVRITSVNTRSSASWTGTYYSGGPIERAAGDPPSTTWNARLVWKGILYSGETEGVTLRVSHRERNYNSTRLPDRQLNCQ